MNQSPYPSTVPDDELLRKVADKDRDAFLALYDRFSASLMGRIHSVLRDRSSSEDVLQEVMLEIWNKHAARYDPVLGRVDAWLLRLARSRAIDWGRRKSVRFAHSLDFETHDRCSLEPRMKSMDAAFLHGALKELPDHEQMPVYLSFLNGLTHEEIALHMDIPLGTVKTRIRLAIIRLRKELVPQGANP